MNETDDYSNELALLVSNLHTAVTESALRNLFSFCGPVRSVDIRKQTLRDRNNPSHTALIVYEHAVSCEYALMAFDDAAESANGPTYLYGMPIRVRYAHFSTQLPCWLRYGQHPYTFPSRPSAFDPLPTECLKILEAQHFWPSESDLSRCRTRQLNDADNAPEPNFAVVVYQQQQQVGNSANFAARFRPPTSRLTMQQLQASSHDYASYYRARYKQRMPQPYYQTFQQQMNFQLRSNAICQPQNFFRGGGSYPIGVVNSNRHDFAQPISACMPVAQTNSLIRLI